MSYAQDNGYTPQTIAEIINSIRLQINSEFNTSYTEATFVGTKWYQFVYSVAQRMQQNETKASEIFQKLQQYISLTNDRIQRPSVSYPGLIESFESKGYRVSVKAQTEAEAGFISIAVDISETLPDGVTPNPDFEDEKLEVATLIKDFVAAGMIYLGDQVVNIVLPNGQPFDFKFFLPNKTPILLRLTADISDNNLIAVPDDETLRIQLFNQISARYRMGLDFEPQRYFNTTDAFWASDILLEYSLDAGTTWQSAVFEAEFDDLLTFGLEDITVDIT